MTLRARTNGKPVVLHVERVTIEPPIQGLLDGLLPSRDVPTGLYHASSVRPLAQEATSILALESLLRDRDLVFGPGDAARAKERWSRGPAGLELRPGAGGVRVYDQPLAHLLVALPFFALGGPSGVVVLNLVLLLVMAVLLWLDLRHHGLAGKLFALAPFVAAAGCGFVFLPQPQVFEMFCLFLPVRWWLRGDLGEAPARVLAAGVLVGAAGIQEPAWLLVPAVCGIDLAFAGRRRSALALAATALAFAALPAFAPRDLFAGPPVQAASPAVASATEDGSAVPREGLGDLAVDTWRLYTARNGLVAGYPFALLSLVLFFRGAEHRSRLLLFAALAVLTLWIALTGAATALQSPLGSPRFAVIAPLFSLLPDRPGSLRAQVVPWIVALLLTLGVMSSAWTPGSS